ILLPASRDKVYLRSSSTGSVLKPNGIIPSASNSPFMVDAVPMVLHAPKPQLSALPISFHSCSVILPVRNSSQYFQRSVPLPSRWPLNTPTRLGPALSCSVGRFALHAPISKPGTVLSQLPSNTTPSIGYDRIFSSTSSDSRFRYSMAVGFMSSSPSDITGNSSGMPPASRTPFFTSSAIVPRLMLQLLNSDHVLAIPMTGCPSYASISIPTERSAP